MNKQEILQKIKDEVAREFDWKDYEDACSYVTTDDKGNQVPVIMRYVNLCDEIANRYAITMCEEQKKECYHEANSNNHKTIISSTESIKTVKNVAE